MPLPLCVSQHGLCEPVTDATTPSLVTAVSAAVPAGRDTGAAGAPEGGRGQRHTLA